MHSTLVLASLLPFLTAAKPLRHTTPAPFGLIAARSASPIHYQSVNANGESFWVAKDTATYCPRDVVSHCPPGNTTEIVYGDSTASLNVEVPGGQRLYVLPTGALSFTSPHSASTNNGTPTGFTYTPPGTSGSLGVFGFDGLGATGFLACPAGEDGGAPWQVFADVKGIRDADVPGGSVAGCLGFDALVAGGEGKAGAAAWEYV